MDVGRAAVRPASPWAARAPQLLLLAVPGAFFGVFFAYPVLRIVGRGLWPDGRLDLGAIAAVKMGTTVATNALLERRGEPTALVITRGFGDALRIGTQARPDLFALDIVVPDVVYSTVVEVDERVAADGTVLVPLDVDAPRVLDLVRSRLVAPPIPGSSPLQR